MNLRNSLHRRNVRSTVLNRRNRRRFQRNERNLTPAFVHSFFEELYDTGYLERRKPEKELTQKQIKQKLKKISSGWEARALAKEYLPPQLNRVKCGASSLLVHCKKCHRWEITGRTTKTVICGSCNALIDYPISKEERRQFRQGKRDRRRKKKRERALKKARRARRKKRG